MEPARDGDSARPCRNPVALQVEVVKSGVAEGILSLDAHGEPQEDRPTYHLVLRLDPDGRRRAQELLAGREEQLVELIAGGKVISNLFVSESDIRDLEVMRDSEQEINAALALVTKLEASRSVPDP